MFRKGKRLWRPFKERAQLKTRACSTRLQRIVTDLAADLPFVQAAEKVKEHHGVVVPPETIRRILNKHAAALQEKQQDEIASLDWPAAQGEAQVIVQMDGGMVPIVSTDEEQADRRQGKTLQWKELKLGLAYPTGKATPVYGGTLTGGVDGAGSHLFHCAKAAGLGSNTQVHAVGDGASWIASQVEEKFGSNGSYLIDFYHACDYLAQASSACGGDQAAAWLKQQKTRLKANQVNQVLAELEPYCEPESTSDEKAPVRSCYRYFENHREQLDYAGAIEKGLPIGSGKIESAHRYVVQQRLKRPGAWWKIDGAERMLALRLNRANNQWEDYWSAPNQKAA